MITDARALRPAFVPRDMAHRDGAIDHLASVLDPHLLGENITIYGPSGCGKTTLARYVLRQLEQHSLDFRWGYANCISDSSRVGVLHQLVRDVGLGRDMRRSGTPPGEYLDRLRGVDGVLALVLDEVDVVDDPTLIAALADLPDVSLITICVDQDKLHATLRDEERVRTRIRAAETVQLDCYTHAELVDILWYRVDHGLDAGRVEEDAVDAIADIAAGNARHGIALLRRGARAVQAGAADELTAEVVAGVSEEARADIRTRRIRSLGTHKRALFEIVREHGGEGVGSGAVHRAYAGRVQDPKSKRTVRRYLESLERYGLVVGEGEKSGRRYQSLV